MKTFSKNIIGMLNAIGIINTKINIENIYFLKYLVQCEACFHTN